MSWILWPFTAAWRCFALLLVITGRLVGVVFGLSLLLVGLVVSLTLVAAPVGIPFAILGFLLIVRSLW